mgnify:CR=1 FL=1
MAFGWGHYYAYGNSNNCVNQYSWFPDGSNWVYDSITYWYQWAFKRNAESGGTYYWYSVFTNPAPPSQGGNSFVDGGTGANSTYNTPLFLYIYNAGIANGEYGANHTWLGAGFCPILGCTNPNANNYNSSATQDDGSCTYNYGCTDPSATNYDPNAYINDGSCQYIIYGCTDSTANNYNPSANVNQGCTYDQPTVSLSSNPVSIIAGQSSTLSWSTNYAVSGTIQPINYSISPVSGGTRVVYPTSNTTYNLTVYGVPNGGKSASNTTTVVVYTPPNTNISLASSTIPLGNSTTLSWATTGDASSASINQGIGSVPLNSNTTVNPTSTTTYTISVSGNGGSDSDSVTLTVVPPPTCSITASPNPVPYGTNVSLTYSSTNATNVNLYRYYTIDGVETQMTITTLLTNSTNTYLTDSIDWNNTYNGQVSTLNAVRYMISATNGITTQTATTATIPTLSDMMPDLIVIPPSGPLPPEDEPVISPDVQSNSLLVDDIDLPVEIKSDHPIKVDIDDAGNWQDVQEI